MTREDFVRRYAEGSSLSTKWASLGLIDVDGKTLLALPCGCTSAICEGWAMVTADGVLDHLELDAPEGLRIAYRDAMKSAELKQTR